MQIYLRLRPSTSNTSMLDYELVEDVEVPHNKEYNSMTLAGLRMIAKERCIEGYSSMKKAELIDILKDKQIESKVTVSEGE